LFGGRYLRWLLLFLLLWFAILFTLFLRVPSPNEFCFTGREISQENENYYFFEISIPKSFVVVALELEELFEMRFAIKVTI